MANERIRVRLTRLPSVRDYEYFARRYLRVNGVYEVPLELANDLINFGCAALTDEPVTNTDSFLEIEEDQD